MFCDSTTIYAHHILERRLFPNGGYYLDNGASVCDFHHRACESTEITVDEVRAAAGITQIIVPPGCDSSLNYDKWGNQVLPSGQRLAGPLFDQDSVQKSISDYLHLFVESSSQMHEIIKYPRTAHLSGSKLQGDDTEDGQIHVSDLPEGECVWEEKLDGGNCGVSHTLDLDLLLQSRGHELLGGAREAQFDLFKAWSNRHQDAFFDRLGTRYQMYGEWMYAKHTIYYDRLPHFFMEFDILDKESGRFLDTPSRHKMLDGLPVVSVPVVHVGRLKTTKEVRALIKPSLYKSPDWRASLLAAAAKAGVPEETVLRETSMTDESEGLYLKVERDGHVVGRYKFVRPDFVQAIVESGTHWVNRTVIPNGLAEGVDIFA